MTSISIAMPATIVGRAVGVQAGDLAALLVGHLREAGEQQLAGRELERRGRGPARGS